MYVFYNCKLKNYFVCTHVAISCFKARACTKIVKKSCDISKYVFDNCELIFDPKIYFACTSAAMSCFKVRAHKNCRKKLPDISKYYIYVFNNCKLICSFKIYFECLRAV